LLPHETAIDRDLHRVTRAVTTAKIRSVSKHGGYHRFLQIFSSRGSHQYDLGAWPHGGRLPFYILQSTIETHSPALGPTASRTDDDLLGVEAKDRPETDAKSARGPRTASLGRRVEGKEISPGVLENHSRTVVEARDTITAPGLRGRDRNVMGAGVPGVLQKLTDENPPVAPVSCGLEAGALKEGAGIRIHDDSVGVLLSSGLRDRDRERDRL
jgi:hypothetical protein